MESSTLPPRAIPTTAPPIAAADACPACGTPLAADQRYCLQCGERRGEPRLPVMAGRPGASAVTTVTTTSSAPAGAPRAPRGTAGTTLVAGVGTLLLALGVGVLIGHSAEGGSQQAKVPPVQFVTVPGGAATGTAGTADASTPGAASTGSKATKNAHGSHAKGRKAASSIVTPKSGSTVPKKTGTVVTLGQKGHGRGYTNGKFTGNFFGQ